MDHFFFIFVFSAVNTICVQYIFFAKEWIWTANLPILSEATAPKKVL